MILNAMILNAERPPGGGLFFNELNGRGVGGWGSRSTCPYVTAAPIKRKSALGDYPLSLGIGHFGHSLPAGQCRVADC